ncbi:hypothetical protein PQX77_016658 [Marasmius sp. AFHP31]|nr:hypothetical protein PQX77_016658 [Marasmius sp. AFHP31]
MIIKLHIQSVTDMVIPDHRELSEFDVWNHLRSLQPVAVSNPSRLHTFIHEANIELSDYDQLIHALESQVLEAKSKRDSLQRHASQVSSLLSPIRRLPTEILVKFFECTANSDFLGRNLLGANSVWKSQALRISSVCYRWRTIALDTPQLWARFAVDLDPRAGPPLDLFLSRSRECKLGVTITDIDYYKSLAPTLFRSLIAHSSRWSSLDHHYPHKKVTDLMNEVRELPSLEYVVCPAQGRDTPVLLSKPLRQCSSLKTVVVRYDHYNKVDITSLPLDFIDCLVFQLSAKGAFNHSLQVLKSCTEIIKELVYQSVRKAKNRKVIRPVIHTSLGNDVQERIECRGVRKLTVDLYHPHGIYPHLQDTFRSLTLPSLIDLQLIGECDTDSSFEGSWPAHFFDEFIVRSTCTLTTLTVNLPLSDEDVIASLRHFPYLETLSITELFTNKKSVADRGVLAKTVTRSLMDKLTMVDPRSVEPASLVFLPKLRSLRLSVHAHFDADVEFVGMVKSRWYPFSSGSVDPPSFVHCRLESAVLGIRGRDAEKSVYEPLKVYDSEGMKIVVKANGAYVV